MTRASIILLIVAGQIASVATVAQAMSTPGKPLELIAPPPAKYQPSLAEDAKTRRERRAECEAQADKLFPGQKKKFMKECMANRS